jgi:hypothetical protein
MEFGINKKGGLYMLKKILKKIRTFWWGGLLEITKYYNTGIYSFISIHRQRNDDEYIIKKRIDNPLYLERYGYKVFSQNDEDGIIEEIFNRIGTTNKIFIEFGVGNGLECNSHYLLHKGWSGLWIEGDYKSYSQILKLFSIPIKTGKLKIINAFINKDNINSLIKNGLVDYICIGRDNISGLIDILSIDIDGNDYWIWEAINYIQARLVIIEYNAKFPPNHEWIMKYDRNHIWERDDEQGASLKSLEILGRKLGYQLVGTNFNGVNAFFIKQDIAHNLFPIPSTAENLYNPSRWYIKYISGHPSNKYI